MLPPYNGAGAADGPFLFNLVSDPTESHDLSKVSQRAATARSHHCSFAHELRSMSNNTRCVNNACMIRPMQEQPARFSAMVAAMNKWEASIEVSMVTESQCAHGASPPGPPPSPSPDPPLPPMPPTPPSGGYSLKNGSGKCLTLLATGGGGRKYYIGMGPCDGGSKWEEDLESGKYIANLGLKKGEDLMKLDGEGHGRSICSLGNTIWTGAESGNNAFELQTVGSTSLLASAGCKSMYAGMCKTGPYICLAAHSEALEFTQGF